MSTRLLPGLEARLAPHAERVFRLCPRLARSPLGYPLRYLLARRMRGMNLFDVYGMDHVGDVSFAEAPERAYLRGRPRPGLLAPLVDPERYRARFGLRADDDLAVHYAARAGEGAGAAIEGAFDADVYRRDNPDLAPTRTDPTAHFLWRGHHEARSGGWDAFAQREPDFGALRPRAGRRSEVCVIVPVHNGRAQTLRCLHSVLSAPVEAGHRIMVIDDASDDPVLAGELDELASRGLIGLVRNPCNAGFSGSVNAGLLLLAEGEHAVLLNSDTTVHGDWLDRLLRIVRDDARIGTVTPLSSSATILSYPVVLRDNPRPLEASWARIDSIVREIDAPPVPIPTAIGSCTLVTAACLRETGLLDAAAFPAGYGEENDFCCRAAALGWHHRAAANVFVYHEGAASFGARRAALVEAGLAVIDRRYPHYRAAVGQHIAADPLAGLRMAIDCRRIADLGGRRTLWHWLGPTAPAGFRDTDLRLFRRADGVLRVHCPAAPVTPNLPDIKLPQDMIKFTGLLRAMGVVGVRLHGRSWLGGTLASLASVAASLDVALD